MDQERDDYADLDLAPPKKVSARTVAMIAIAAIAFVVFFGLPLLARILAPRLVWP